MKGRILALLLILTMPLVFLNSCYVEVHENIQTTYSLFDYDYWDTNMERENRYSFWRDGYVECDLLHRGEYIVITGQWRWINNGTGLIISWNTPHWEDEIWEDIIYRPGGNILTYINRYDVRMVGRYY